MSQEIIKNVELQDVPSVGIVGGKGLGLLKLAEQSKGQDFEVPEFYVIPVGFEYTEKNLEYLYKQTEGPLAIRSSSPYEDSKGYSFAGRFESVLNVRDFDSFKKAIKTVLESATGGKAMVYANEHGIKIDNKMAIVVQKMIDPYYSGVCYSTCNPNNPKTMVECMYGLSDNLMSGDRQGALVSFDENFNLKMEYGDANYIGLEKVALAAKYLEDINHNVLDIEFAVSNEGKLYILQGRPITDPNWEKIQLPVIDKSRLLSEADVVRGSGIFTGSAFIFRSPSELNKLSRLQNKIWENMVIDQKDELKEFDEKNPDGYCLIADTLEQHNEILRLELQNLKVLVTVNYASRFSHPLKVVSEMGIFYLGILGRRDLLDSITTGDKITIASDQSTGIIYDLEEKKTVKSKPEKIDLTKMKRIKLDDVIDNPLPNWEEVDQKLILNANGELGVYFENYNEENGIPTDVFYKLIDIKRNIIIARGGYRSNRVQIQYLNFLDLLIDLFWNAKIKAAELK